MWASAEFATVILCACFPTFPRLFRHLTNRDDHSTKYLYTSSNRRDKPGVDDPKAVRDPYPLEETKQDTVDREMESEGTAHSNV